VNHGRICYIEIPATDVESSARFYAQVFGWKIRARGDGSTSFDDAGTTSGSWVLGRSASSEPGLVVHIMVDSVEATLEMVVAEGGSVVMPFTPISPAGDAYATFRDPASNVLGVYQEGRK
jgi:predicted enzyme related to lactoylglutathione lyase